MTLTQKIAKFLLIVLCYPFLAMREPGTLYPPAVHAERNRKQTNDVLWFVAFSVLAIGWANHVYGDLGAIRMACAALIMIAFCVDLRVGILLTCIIGFILHWGTGLVGVILFLAWQILAVGLAILSMTAGEFEAFKARRWSPLR